jgi:hypothetical protein
VWRTHLKLAKYILPSSLSIGLGGFYDRGKKPKGLSRIILHDGDINFDKWASRNNLWKPGKPLAKSNKYENSLRTEKDSALYIQERL